MYFLYIIMVAFSLFGFDVYWYWLFYLISFLIWYFILWFILSKIKNTVSNNIINLLKNKKDDFFFFIILWVMLWWRLGHFLIYYPLELFSNPLIFFWFHQWWMSFIWWIIWVIISLFVFFKKNKLTTSEIWQVLDITVSLIPIWSLIWRWGNFLNQELYGIPVGSSFLSSLSVSTTSFLEKIHILHIYDKVDEVLRINTNMLASLWEWLFVLFLVQIVFWKIYWKNRGIKGNKKAQKRAKRNNNSVIARDEVIHLKQTKKVNNYWLVSFVRLFGYSLIRFLLEYIRQDSQWEFVWRFTKSQRFFLLFMFLCGFFIIRKMIRKK